MLTPDNPYYRQVRLLVGVLPFIAHERCFALKGGTAINLFMRDMPRLSVDIDLSYLPAGDRATALGEIEAALLRTKTKLEDVSPPYSVHISKRQDNKACGLRVTGADAAIEIEVAPVLRGNVFPPVVRRLASRAESEFGFAEIQSQSFEDIYAGKLVAALDRQHPRDLFDIMVLLENEGISDELFRAFLVYLIGHDGSLARVVDPAPKPIADLYERQFSPMSLRPVTIDELDRARRSMIVALHARFSDEVREFLLSFKRMQPRWELLGVPHAPDLPAVQWKMLNLSRMEPPRHREVVQNLERVLERIAQ